jgi:uncharacterized lipoprotein
MFADEDMHAYRNAKSIKPIEMPPGLVLQNSQESLLIPDQTSGKLASAEELEQPPVIVTSVDLKVLDDEGETKSVTAESSKNAESKTKNTSLKISATKDDNGDSLLLVDGEFDKVWSLVKPALIELGFTIDDASRGNELYAISKELPTLDVSGKAIHPGDVKPEVKEEYQIHVKPSGEKTKISVHNNLGQLEGSGLADHLLLQIKEIMENPKKTSANDA